MARHLMILSALLFDHWRLQPRQLRRLQTAWHYLETVRCCCRAHPTATARMTINNAQSHFSMSLQAGHRSNAPKSATRTQQEMPKPNPRRNFSATTSKNTLVSAAGHQNEGERRRGFWKWQSPKESFDVGADRVWPGGSIFDLSRESYWRTPLFSVPNSGLHQSLGQRHLKAWQDDF